MEYPNDNVVTNRRIIETDGNIHNYQQQQQQHYTVVHRPSTPTTRLNDQFHSVIISEKNVSSSVSPLHWTTPRSSLGQLIERSTSAPPPPPPHIILHPFVGDVASTGVTTTPNHPHPHHQSSKDTTIETSHPYYSRQTIPMIPTTIVTIEGDSDVVDENDHEEDVMLANHTLLDSVSEIIFVLCFALLSPSVIYERKQYSFSHMSSRFLLRVLL